MRNTRIRYWCYALLIAYGLTMVSNVIENYKVNASKEKQAIYVCAPQDMQSAFNQALKSTDMKSDYEIIMTESQENANIIVCTNKEFDPKYSIIAYSPFICAYSSDDDYSKKLLKSGVVTEAFFDDDYYEIDIWKVIYEAIGEGKWANLGIEDMGDLKVYYPHEDTEYWNDFYDFMLLTVNGGTYPETEIDLKLAMDKVSKFKQSKYTEAVRDFDEKIIRNGGFQPNTFYLIPEKVCFDISKETYVFYPLTTTYVNYYIKADDVGRKIVEAFKFENGWGNSGYSRLASEYYRNDFKPNYEAISDRLKGARNAYNIVHLEKDRIKPSDLN